MPKNRWSLGLSEGGGNFRKAEACLRTTEVVAEELGFRNSERSQQGTLDLTTDPLGTGEN